MEKVNYDSLPRKMEVFKEDNLFILYCALCGIDLLHVEGQKPYVGTEKLLKDTATAHNRAIHWVSLGGDAHGKH